MPLVTKSDAGGPDYGATFVLTGATVATFPALQRFLRSAIEQIAFRDLYEYAPTVQRPSTEITRSQDVRVIADRIIEQLCTTLDLSWASIIVKDNGTNQAFGAGACPSEADLNQFVSGISSNLADGGHRFGLVIGSTGIGSVIVGPKRRDSAFQPVPFSR